MTASKAIIEKEYQPKVIVSTTGPNPFNKLTDRELEEYRKEVERKQKGPEGWFLCVGFSVVECSTSKFLSNWKVGYLQRPWINYPAFVCFSFSIRNLKSILEIKCVI